MPKSKPVKGRTKPSGLVNVIGWWQGREVGESIEGWFETMEVRSRGGGEFARDRMAIVLSDPESGVEILLNAESQQIANFAGQLSAGDYVVISVESMENKDLPDGTTLRYPIYECKAGGGE